VAKNGLQVAEQSSLKSHEAGRPCIGGAGRWHFGTGTVDRSLTMNDRRDDGKHNELINTHKRQTTGLGKLSAAATKLSRSWSFPLRPPMSGELTHGNPTGSNRNEINLAILVHGGLLLLSFIIHLLKTHDSKTTSW